MTTLLQDLRYAARSLRKSPGFTLVAVLTLALGIGATSAIFSVINGVLLRPLPYPEPDRIVQLWQIGAEGNRMNVSGANYRDLRERSRSFAALAQYGGGTASVVGGSEPARTGVARVSADFFRVLGVTPAHGRGFAPEEQLEGGAPAVLVSHGYWQRYLGGDPAVVGRTLTFWNRVYTVVGVMPPGFAFPEGTELWTPSELDAETATRTGHNWKVVGRLANGATLARAQQETSAIARQLKEQYGDDTWMVDAAVVPLHEQIVGRVRGALLVLLGAAGFLLLIAGANVTNLLLARAASRQRELAVRTALGAGWRRLAQQFLAESLVLSLAGGTLGVLLAVWGVRALLAAEPGRLPRTEEIGVDWTVVAFALGLSLLVAIALGAGASWRARRGDVRGVLAAGQRTLAGGGAGQHVRGALVTSQIALTLVLLIGASLLARSLTRLLAVDPGYRTAGAVTLSLSLPEPADEADAQRLAYLHRDLVARLGAIPGVEAVGGTNVLPLSGDGADGMFLILERPDEVTGFEDWARLNKVEGRTGYASYRVVDEGYFRAMRIPLVRGRLFGDSDTRDAPHVAVISRSLAEQRWPNEDPIGKLIQYGNMDGDLRAFTIVGVVGDVRDRGLEAEPQPTFYGSSRQRIGSTYDFSYVLQGPGDPGAVTAAARRIVREVAPDVPPRFRTLEEIFSASLAQRRFSMLLLSVFGAAALMLATMGIYGVISYAVTQRTREIGIRMALGAAEARVVRLVLRQGMMATAAGGAIGIAGALGLTRLVRSQLYGVSATDPLTFVGVALLLASVALLASVIPARRAVRVDPMVALRAE